MFTATHISTSAPTVNDDLGLGFIKGTLWFNETTQRFYLSEDDADGAADWQEVSGGTITTWEDWTPTYSWVGNTPTGISTVARFVLAGKACFFTLQVSGTTSGIGNLTNMTATLPALATVVDNNSLVPVETYRTVGGSTDNNNMASIDSVVDPAVLNHTSFTSIGTGTAFTLYFSGRYETQ